MLFGLLMFGILLTASGVKGTEHQLGKLVAGDFTNSSDGPSFLYWAASICGIGALGLIPGMQRVSNMLLILLFVVIVLSDNGVWANFVSAVQDVSQTGIAPTIANTGATSSGGGSSSGGSSGGGAASTLSSIGSDAAIGATIGGPYGAAAGAVVGLFSSIL